MGHQYYRQAKFAAYRFRSKLDPVKAHEAAYLESKDVERFTEPTNRPSHGTDCRTFRAEPLSKQRTGASLGQWTATSSPWQGTPLTCS